MLWYERDKKFSIIARGNVEPVITAAVHPQTRRGPFVESYGGGSVRGVISANIKRAFEDRFAREHPNEKYPLPDMLMGSSVGIFGFFLQLAPKHLQPQLAEIYERVGELGLVEKRLPIRSVKIPSLFPSVNTDVVPAEIERQVGDLLGCIKNYKQNGGQGIFIPVMESPSGIGHVINIVKIENPKVLMQLIRAAIHIPHVNLSEPISAAVLQENQHILSTRRDIPQGTTLVDGGISHSVIWEQIRKAMEIPHATVMHISPSSITNRRIRDTNIDKLKRGFFELIGMEPLYAREIVGLDRRSLRSLRTLESIAQTRDIAFAIFGPDNEGLDITDTSPHKIRAAGERAYESTKNLIDQYLPYPAKLSFAAD